VNPPDGGEYPPGVDPEGGPKPPVGGAVGGPDDGPKPPDGGPGGGPGGGPNPPGGGPNPPVAKARFTSSSISTRIAQMPIGIPRMQQRLMHGIIATTAPAMHNVQPLSCRICQPAYPISPDAARQTTIHSAETPKPGRSLAASLPASANTPPNATITRNSNAATAPSPPVTIRPIAGALTRVAGSFCTSHSLGTCTATIAYDSAAPLRIAEPHRAVYGAARVAGVPSTPHPDCRNRRLGRPFPEMRAEMASQPARALPHTLFVW
jgi:hypothetical protein